jgi:hypothetical protein
MSGPEALALACTLERSPAEDSSRAPGRRWLVHRCVHWNGAWCTAGPRASR